jgi:hypothetical protein
MTLDLVNILIVTIHALAQLIVGLSMYKNYKKGRH